MDNQHKKITGYRDLSQEEIDLINAIKKVGEDLGGLVERVQMIKSADPRWCGIAKTHLQQGMMALTRAVAQQTTF
ncbi:MAG TPA: hypothetical protein VF928_09310 [Usitatibacteraceae bacterium]